MATFGASLLDLERFKVLLAQGTLSLGSQDRVIVDGVHYRWTGTNFVVVPDVEGDEAGELPLTVTERKNFRSLVSGARIADAVSRNITTDDNGQFLAPTGALTYTIPAGLSPMPSFTVDCPASGTISIARSGGATLNGAGTTLTRTRASNPVGFVVLAHESDAYGVSGQ